MRRQKSKPTFSVIVPVYNHYRYISKCIKSILDQTFKDFEVIIIDDHSPDQKIVPYLQELDRAQEQVHLILSKQNIGIANIQNMAIKYANGKYLAFVDCDDYLEIDALMTVDSYLQQHPLEKYIFTDRIYIDENDGELGKSEYTSNYEITDKIDHKNNLLVEMMASHLKVVARQELLEIGGFNVDTAGVQDYDIALKFSEMYPMGYINQHLYFHRIHQNSVTSSRRTEQHIKSGVVLRRALRRRLGGGCDEKTAKIYVNADFVSPAETTQFLFWQLNKYKVSVNLKTYEDFGSIIPKIGLIDELRVSSMDNELIKRINDDLSIIIQEGFIRVFREKDVNNI